MEKSVQFTNESVHRWFISSDHTENRSDPFVVVHWLNIVFVWTEVEFDPKREEKEQYEAKMREIEKIERLRKEKEEAGRAELLFNRLKSIVSFLFKKKIQLRQKITIH